MRILLMEREPQVRAQIHTFLNFRGFDVAVTDSLRRIDASMAAWSPHLLLIDIDQLSGDVPGILQELTRAYRKPVVVLSRKKETRDKVRALRAGADDYLTFPLDLEEVEARIRAVLRRSGPVHTPLLRIGQLTIDDEAKEVRWCGRLIHLSRKEYQLLRLLASRPGRVFSSLEILRHVWPERAEETAVEDVKKYVYFLRSKLEADPSRPCLIQTVRGFGYKLSPAVGQEQRAG